MAEQTNIHDHKIDEALRNGGTEADRVRAHVLAVFERIRQFNRARGSKKPRYERTGPREGGPRSINPRDGVARPFWGAG